METEDDFFGDKASKGALLELLDEIRTTLRKTGPDPLAAKASEEISKISSTPCLPTARPKQVVQSAIEKFSAASHCPCFGRKPGTGTERIVFGEARRVAPALLASVTVAPAEPATPSADSRDRAAAAIGSALACPCTPAAISTTGTLRWQMRF
jgi:hypothetical protein